MRPSIRLGRVFGIEIGLHYSWFVIALLIVLSLSAHFHIVNPQWSLGLTWSLAAITGLLFFASIVAHELSHAAVANARGMPVRSITLFALGGVANIGLRPTVGGLVPRLEAHLFDIDIDLYGRHLRVALVDFIRPEQKFDGLDALKAQIAADAIQARAILAATPSCP